MLVMTVAKNWGVRMVLRSAGWFIVISGLANTKTKKIIPLLKKKIPQPTDASVLQLELTNVSEAETEVFQEVQYIQKTASARTYASVEIFQDDVMIETFEI